MTNREKLLTRISLLSEDDITALLDAVMLMTDMNNARQKPDCPYCSSSSIIREYSGGATPDWRLRRNGISNPLWTETRKAAFSLQKLQKNVPSNHAYHHVNVSLSGKCLERSHYRHPSW